MRSRAFSLMKTFAEQAPACPCHGGGAAMRASQTVCGVHGHSHSHGHDSHTHSARTQSTSTTPEDVDYAFEMASSTIRFGPGVTAEVGMDFANMGAKHVMLVTDPHLADMRPVQVAAQSLAAAGVKYTLYDQVRVEPNDVSIEDAIAEAKAGRFDAFLAVGGGSVMDTAKAANLYSTFPDADLLTFVNAPIGEGQPVPGPLKPLIAVPTTSGTGSETTGVSIFDYTPLGAKTGIANRMLRPSMGIVDPLNTISAPREVKVAAGFDVLCHALESWTAVPYNRRSPRPTNPALRPAYQGSNPASDIWAQHALRICQQYFERSVEDPEDVEACVQMALAAAYAGVGFGNAGVHLAHGMSYPVSGLNKSYTHPGYDADHPIVPHGVSVILNAPAVFKYTAPTNPGRHAYAARLLGADISTTKEEDAGLVLADTIKGYMQRLGVPEGLSAIGFSQSDVPALVEGALPQRRVLNIAPNPPEADDLAALFEDALTNN